MADFNQILRDGKIIDNKRVKSLNMKKVLKIIAQDSEGFKCAVGYFYIEGLVEIINSLKDLKEIKILMGYETTKPTKEQLIKAFRDKFNQLEDNEQIRPAIKLFYQLVKEYKTLKVRIYFGEEGKSERLHSKSYLFLRDSSTKSLLDRYKAGIIGSLLSKDVPTYNAARMGAFMNGNAGNLAFEKKGYGMTASDIIHEIPEVLMHHTR